MAKAPEKNTSKQARSDLTGYAALLGESFRSRIDLLEQVIQGSHYPSLGRYKERLLSQLISDYIPRSCEVGTGFVLFPHETDSHPGGPLHHDPLNRSAFAVSKQCDILVFDSSSVPPVFRDGDFVVLRAEAVRAVVEVKGSLSLGETDSMLSSFGDFATKWRTTQKFYREHHQPEMHMPELFGMAWQIQARPDGSPVTTPTKIRERVAAFYREFSDAKHHKEFPILNHLFIYDECDITSCVMSGKRDGKDDLRQISLGWATRDGKFVRFKDSAPYRDKDRTIAALLAGIHYVTGRESFNRFFSYVDEDRRVDTLPHPHDGFSPWTENLEAGVKDVVEIVEEADGSKTTNL